MVQEQTDDIFVVEIAGRAVVAFKASSPIETPALLNKKWFLDELRELVSEGRYVWDGKTRLRARPADAIETAAYHQTTDEEINGIRVAYLLPLDDVLG